jgi:hypothetical protein
LSGLQAAGHRPTLVAGIVRGERPQIDTIKSDDGKQAESPPDPLSSRDPLLSDAHSDSMPEKQTVADPDLVDHAASGLLTDG